VATILNYNTQRNRVRIVAKQNGTNISQTGGTIQNVTGGKLSLSNLQAGDFVELEVNINSNGCSITADNAVGVCAYLPTGGYDGPSSNAYSDPSQAWLPSIEQTAPEALISAFKPTETNPPSVLEYHNALIITPYETRNNTMVSVGGDLPKPLSVSWRNNIPAGMSFASYELTDLAKPYHFTNDAGLIVMGYGYGVAESYYYLGYSSMRNLEVAFYANSPSKSVYYSELIDNLFCGEHDIELQADFAEIENMDSIKWYIDDVLQPLAPTQITWTHNSLPEVIP